MSDIPTEVIFEILCCLPVESLLKFRCVCKTWKALIDSPRFEKMHLNRSLELKSVDINAKLILCGDFCWCDVSFELLDTRIDAQSTMITVNYPLKHEECLTLIMGYCNGLFLVTCGLDCALWNPSTRKFIRLPDFEHNKPKEGITFFQYQCGFGYDKITDDYKVMRIMQASGADQNCSKTVVYSLKSHSYRRTKEFPFWISQDLGGIFVFGALHWLVSVPSETHNEYMVVAFDLGSEEYKLVPLPLQLGAPNQVDLGVFEGCLSMSCNYECEHVDIWLMRESWAKFLSLEVDVNWSFKENVKPISYSRSGEYIILEKDKDQLIFYDLELKSMRNFMIIHGPPTFNTFLFSGSLVLNGIGGDEGSKKMDPTKEKQKKTKKRDDFLSTGFKLKL